MFVDIMGKVRRKKPIPFHGNLTPLITHIKPTSHPCNCNVALAFFQTHVFQIKESPYLNPNFVKECNFSK